jgi:hypothetical protein
MTRLLGLDQIRRLLALLVSSLGGRVRVDAQELSGIRNRVKEAKGIALGIPQNLLRFMVENAILTFVEARRVDLIPLAE